MRAKIGEEPSYTKHNASSLLGPYTRACSRQEEHPVQGRVQAGHPWTELKIFSQTDPYSPQKGEIPLGTSEWPCHRGQTSPIPQRGEEWQCCCARRAASGVVSAKERGTGCLPAQRIPTAGGSVPSPDPERTRSRHISHPWLHHACQPSGVQLLGTCSFPCPLKESKCPTCHPVGHQALQIQRLFC